MFKRLRIAFLLYLLLFIVAANYLTARHLRAWDSTAWVDVYPINADGSDRTTAFMASDEARDFSRLEAFFAQQAARYGIGLERPLRLELAPELDATLPSPPTSMLGAVGWSLQMRWFLLRLGWREHRSTPDITLFAVYHDGRGEPTLDRSVGLEKGRFAIANLFAEHSMSGSNRVVIAHELLHTLGASDKYDATSDLPRFPDGYAAPDARPLYPQRQAEIMGGRVALGPHSARIPEGLDEAVIGPATALEIGWTDSLRHAGSRSEL